MRAQAFVSALFLGFVTSPHPAWALAPPPSVPPAEPTPRFGDPRQFVITDALDASIHRGGYTGGEASAFSVTLEPSLHYFIRRGLSLGGVILVEYQAQSVSLIVPYGPSEVESKSLAVGGALAVGENLPLSKLISIWFRGQPGIRYAHSTVRADPGYAGVTELAVAPREGFVFDFAVKMPILFHPTQHFFVGIGPDLLFETNFSGGSLWADFGVSSMVGGWL